MGGRRSKAKKYAVIVECPRCHKEHIDYRVVRPFVKPRVYCRAHEWLRYESDEGDSHTKTRKAAA